jgi:hypothetical protein
MRFIIHFTINGEDDFFSVEGDTIEEIREKASEFFSLRGLVEKECNPWSEEY